MKKHLVRILLIVLALCTMTSLTSCVRFNVDTVACFGGEFESGYLYAFKYKADAKEGGETVEYIYSTDKLDVDDEITVSTSGAKGIVTEVVEKYPVLVIEGLRTYFISYYEFNHPYKQTFKSLEKAQEYTPERHTTEVDKSSVVIIVYNTEEGGEEK